MVVVVVGDGGSWLMTFEGLGLAILQLLGTVPSLLSHHLRNHIKQERCEAFGPLLDRNYAILNCIYDTRSLRIYRQNAHCYTVCRIWICRHQDSKERVSDLLYTFQSSSLPNFQMVSEEAQQVLWPFLLACLSSSSCPSISKFGTRWREHSILLHALLVHPQFHMHMQYNNPFNIWPLFPVNKGG